MNPPTFPASLLKTSGLATSMWDPILDPFSSEYELESKTSIGFALPLYTLLSPTPPLSSPSPIDSPPSYHTISQYNLHTIIRQQQKQLVAMQVQIQALIVEGAVAEREQYVIASSLLVLFTHPTNYFF